MNVDYILLADATKNVINLSPATGEFELALAINRSITNAPINQVS